MTKQTGLGNLDDLFQSARGDGLGNDTLDLVVSNLDGPTMAGAVGTPLDQLGTSQVTLGMNVLDMSGSMSPHAADLMAAYNDAYLDAMAGAVMADEILVSTITFDNQVELLHGYLNLDDVPRLTPRNYTPRASTALYDAVAGALTNMVLYTQQLRQSGIAVRCLVMVYSDGEDNASKQTAATVQRTVQDLLRQEIYTMAYVGFLRGEQRPLGFKTGNGNPVQKLADAIGFPHAFSAGLSPAELRRVFYMASTSTVRVSQGGAVGAGAF